MRQPLRGPSRPRGRLAQRPKQRGERAGRGLQQERQIEMIGAEAHAELAQRGAIFWREVRISLATRARSSTPSSSAIWKATPRTAPESPSPVSSGSSAPSSFLMRWASHSSRRRSPCRPGLRRSRDRRAPAPWASGRPVPARSCRRARRASGSSRRLRARRPRPPHRRSGSRAPHTRPRAPAGRRR